MMADVIWPFFGNNIECFRFYSILDWLILPLTFIISWSSEKDPTWKFCSFLKTHFSLTSLLFSFWKHLLHLNYRRFYSLQQVHIYKLSSCVSLIWFDNVQEHTLESEYYHNNSFYSWPRRGSFQSEKGGSPWWSKVSLQRMFHLSVFFLYVTTVLLWPRVFLLP